MEDFINEPSITILTRIVNEFKQERNQLVCDIFDFIDNCADFSNGNTHNGYDEGDIRGREVWEEFRTKAIALGLLGEKTIEEIETKALDEFWMLKNEPQHQPSTDKGYSDMSDLFNVELE